MALSPVYEFINVGALRSMSYSVHVLDHWGKVHSVRVAADTDKAKHSEELNKAANISSHIKEWISCTLILFHSIG